MDVITVGFLNGIETVWRCPKSLGVPPVLIHSDRNFEL